MASGPGGLWPADSAGDLDFAFDQFNGREGQRRDGAGQGATEKQSREGQLFHPREDGGTQCVLDNAVAKEETAGFHGGPGHGGTDPPI